MSVPSYPLHSLPLKLPNKGMCFSFPPLKFPNKGMEEYSKMILFIPFHYFCAFVSLHFNKVNKLNKNKQALKITLKKKN